MGEIFTPQNYFMRVAPFFVIKFIYRRKGEKMNYNKRLRTKCMYNSASVQATMFQEVRNEILGYKCTCPVPRSFFKRRLRWEEAKKYSTLTGEYIKCISCQEKMFMEIRNGKYE